MKHRRQEAICSIINNNDIDTQTALVNKLRERGFVVAQTTISRDIQELRITKIPLENGSYKYVIPTASTATHTEHTAVFNRNVVSVKCAENTVVLHTEPASASLVARAMDSIIDKRILGTIAGFDTVFVIADTKTHAHDICDEMSVYANNKSKSKSS